MASRPGIKKSSLTAIKAFNHLPESLCDRWSPRPQARKRFGGKVIEAMAVGQGHETLRLD